MGILPTFTVYLWKFRAIRLFLGKIGPKARFAWGAGYTCSCEARQWAVQGKKMRNHLIAHGLGMGLFIVLNLLCLGALKVYGIQPHKATVFFCLFAFLVCSTIFAETIWYKVEKEARK